MYRFLLRPRWIAFHLIVVLLVVMMVNLGLWQLRRLDERKEFNADVRAKLAEQPVPVETLLESSTDPSDLQWRPVTAAGTYLPDEQITVVNRSQGGLAGQNTVTPLRLADGRLLLVNRGFTELDVAAPAPPTGTVTIEGHVRTSQRRRFGQLSDPSQGELTSVQRIDIERLRPQLPGEVIDVYVDVVRSTPADGPPPYPVPLPELTEGSHLSYTVQWFIFSVAAVAGWVLAVRRSATTRARRSAPPPVPEAADASASGAVAREPDGDAQAAAPR